MTKAKAIRLADLRHVLAERREAFAAAVQQVWRWGADGDLPALERAAIAHRKARLAVKAAEKRAKEEAK